MNTCFAAPWSWFVAFFNSVDTSQNLELVLLPTQ
jgi:hypothetical protein